MDYRDNPRKVPGIMAKTECGFTARPNESNGVNREIQLAAYGGDYIHPSVFYITNGYNYFEDNMAVGAGTCGACYWFAPARISGLSKKSVMGSRMPEYKRPDPGTAPM